MTSNCSDQQVIFNCFPWYLPQRNEGQTFREYEIMKYIINSFSWVMSILSVSSSVLWDAWHMALAALHKYGEYKATLRAQAIEPRSRPSPPKAEAEISEKKVEGSAYCLSPEFLGVSSMY